MSAARESGREPRSSPQEGATWTASSRAEFEGPGSVKATPALALLALIHRSAWNRNSRKFAKNVSNITHLSDTPTPLTGVCCRR
jgi:hypothetical protein